MKLPSLTVLRQSSSATFRRFPFVIVDAVIGTVAAITLIQLDPKAPVQWMNNVLLAASLGLPLFTAVAVMAEKSKWRQSKAFAVNVTVALSLLGYAMSLPFDIHSAPNIHIIRFFLLNVGLHLLVAFAPFTSRGALNGFWQFNKSLFLRFLTAILYSGVLYIGLAVAILAVDQLFDVNIDGEVYGQLWVLIAGIFNTWFFLGGVPGRLDVLESETGYPKGLKIFSQYVLLPLVLVYLLILYAYEIKIVIEWEWPKGWVSNLVLGFSVTGILSLLLLWPIQDRIENAWIRTFARRYYLALIPLVVLLLLAIWLRIAEYGVTENRYFVAVLGLWLSGVVVYFLLSKTKSIKVIPISLCAIALSTAFGPWGAFGISELSQNTRLLQILLANGMLVEGKVHPPEHRPSFKNVKEISSIVRYLHDVHGVASLQKWFDVNLEGSAADSLAAASRYEKPKLIVRLMGIPYIDEWQSEGGGQLMFTANRQQSISVQGYRHLVRSIHFSRWSANQRQELTFDGTNYGLTLDPGSATVMVVRSGADSASVRILLTPLIKKLMREHLGQSNAYNIPLEEMSVEGSGHGMQVKLFVLSMNVQTSDDRERTDQLEADILVGWGRERSE